MLSRDCGSFTLFKAVQFSNARSSMLLIPSGIVIASSAVQEAKTQYWIFSNFEGNFMFFSELQAWNAKLSMMSTPSGMSMLSS